MAGMPLGLNEWSGLGREEYEHHYQLESIAVGRG
jgi:hypothetical protein